MFDLIVTIWVEIDFCFCLKTWPIILEMISTFAIFSSDQKRTYWLIWN